MLINLNLIIGVYYRYDEELVIPIIENTPFEEDLQVNFGSNILIAKKIV
jgi:hypothetical protein